MKQAIVVIGGYNSIWPAYLGMARDLEDISGLPAVGVPLMAWHWWSARKAENATNLLQQVQDTILWARRKLHAGRFILVGHSAGGVLARLYLCEHPVWDRVYAGVEHISALITLGSPHCDSRGVRIGWFLTDEANRLAPGTPYSNRVRYRTVAGKVLKGLEQGGYRQRRAFRTYSLFAGQGELWGDSVVPVSCAGLDGTEVDVLEGIVHSRKYGRRWYGGSKSIIRRWWPQGMSHVG